MSEKKNGEPGGLDAVIEDSEFPFGEQFLREHDPKFQPDTEQPPQQEATRVLRAPQPSQSNRETAYAPFNENVLAHLQTLAAEEDDEIMELGEAELIEEDDEETNPGTPNPFFERDPTEEVETTRLAKRDELMNNFPHAQGVKAKSTAWLGSEISSHIVVRETALPPSLHATAEMTSPPPLSPPVAPASEEHAVVDYQKTGDGARVTKSPFFRGESEQGGRSTLLLDGSEHRPLMIPDDEQQPIAGKRTLLNDFKSSQLIEFGSLQQLLGSQQITLDFVPEALDLGGKTVVDSPELRLFIQEFIMNRELLIDAIRDIPDGKLDSLHADFMSILQGISTVPAELTDGMSAEDLNRLIACCALTAYCGPQGTSIGLDLNNPLINNTTGHTLTWRDGEDFFKLLFTSEQSQKKTAVLRLTRESKIWSKANGYYKEPIFQGTLNHDKGGQVIGMSMRALNGDILKANMRPPLNEALTNVADALLFLQFLHGKLGVVHRDLKPANIFRLNAADAEKYGSSVVVFDFDVSRLLTEHTIDDDNMKLTNARAFVGTLKYAPPEQLRNQFDHRVDIYAMGCILFELVTGQHPLHHIFGGDDYNEYTAMAAILMQEIDMSPLNSIEPQLAEVIKKALAKEPDNRFQTAQEFLDALIRCPDAQFLFPRVAEVNTRSTDFVPEQADINSLVHSYRHAFDPNIKLLSHNPIHREQSQTHMNWLHRLHSEFGTLAGFPSIIDADISQGPEHISPQVSAMIVDNFSAHPSLQEVYGPKVPRNAQFYKNLFNHFSNLCRTLSHTLRQGLSVDSSLDLERIHVLPDGHVGIADMTGVMPCTDGPTAEYPSGKSESFDAPERRHKKTQITARTELYRVAALLYSIVSQETISYQAGRFGGFFGSGKRNALADLQFPLQVCNIDTRVAQHFQSQVHTALSEDPDARTSSLQQFGMLLKQIADRIDVQ